MPPSFGRLPGLILHIHGPSGSGVRHALPIWKMEIDASLQILEEIAAMPARPVPDLEELADAEGVHDRFVARETARFGAYVLFACAAERVISTACGSVHKPLDALDPGGAAARTASRRELQKRLAWVRKLRNKVFAHPAAVSLQAGDSASLRATSVWMFSGGGAAWVNGEFRLGCARIQSVPPGFVRAVMANAADPSAHAPPSLPSEPDVASLRSATFEELATTVGDAFSGWWGTMSASVLALQGYPDDALGRLFVGLRQVVRTPTSQG